MIKVLNNMKCFFTQYIHVYVCICILLHIFISSLLFKFIEVPIIYKNYLPSLYFYTNIWKISIKYDIHVLTVSVKLITAYARHGCFSFVNNFWFISILHKFYIYIATYVYTNLKWSFIKKINIYTFTQIKLTCD